MPSCSQCGISWTAATDCPRCRRRPKGGEAIGRFGCYAFILIGFPMLIGIGVPLLFGGKTNSGLFHAIGILP